MGQATNVVLHDGAGTPVAVTFTPVKASPELSVWKDRRLAKFAYWPEVTISTELPTTKRNTTRAQLRVAVPVVDAVTGLVTDTIRGSVDFIIPQTAAASDVNNAYAWLTNGLANALLKSAMRDCDPIIG